MFLKNKIFPLFIFLTLFSIACAQTTSNSNSKYKPCPPTTPENMACIPGGSFIRGSNSAKWQDEHPPMKIVISTFLMDKYEVSVKLYKQCIDNHKCTFTRSNYAHMRQPEFPQLKANWYQAQAYCKAQGKRLPTEAEFEKATRGANGEIYSWGNQKADCKRAVIKDKQGRKGCVGGFIHNTGTVDKVGSRPAGRYALYDMTGNAHEWVSDWYHKDYKKCGAACNGRDPKGPCAGQTSCPGHPHKSVKGGSWYWNADWARAAKRRAWQPSNRPPHHFGFRCVKDIG